MVLVALLALWVTAGPAAAERTRLADAPAIETHTLERLLAAPSWPRRAIAAVRLDRFDDEPSLARLHELLADDAWQVRSFAVAALGRRAAPLPEGWLAGEEDPRVLRTAARHRYAIEPERLDRGVRALARGHDLLGKMLAVELAATSDDEDLRELARETARTIILRMDRREAGALSPRLAAVTAIPDLRRPLRWQHWLRRTGRSFTIDPAWAVPPRPEAAPPARIARLEPAQFADLEQYIEILGGRRVDLAICLDVTASMSGELAAAQGGIDDLMLFAGDVLGGLRVGLLAYRDQRDRDKALQARDFSSRLGEVRAHLWSLSAEGGGDRPEAVQLAMQTAFERLSWHPEHVKILVLIGDAPPTVGHGGRCVEMARVAHERFGCTTHVIQTTSDPDEDVEHFPEIAKAGDGRCVRLGEDDSLIAEITGLTLGDRYEQEFREFFEMYLGTCR